MIFRELLLRFNSAENRRLLSNFLSIGIVQVANSLLPLVTIPYIVRIIGPDLFGEISFTQSFVAYFTLAINYGFDLSATREISLNRDDRNKVSEIFSSVISAKIMLLLISCVVFELAIVFFPVLTKLNTLLWYTFLVNIGFVLFPNFVFQGYERLPRMAIFNLLIKIIFSASIFIFLRGRTDFLIVNLSTSLGQIIAGGLAFISVIIMFNLKLTVGTKGVADVLKLGFPLFITTITVSLYTYTNMFMLGLLSNNYEVGLFAASSKLIGVCITVIMMPINLTIFPYIGKLFSSSKTEALLFVKKAIMIVVLITGIASVITFVFATKIIELFYGKEFIEASVDLKILAIMPVVMGINYMLGTQVMINLKFDREFFFVTLFGALLCVILNTLLIPRYGSNGASISWLITEVAIGLGCLLALRLKGFSFETVTD